MHARYEHYPHGADVGVRGYGATLDQAFAQAALALAAVAADPARVAPARRVDLACAAEDAEALLYQFLNAVIFEMETRGLVFGRFEVEVKDGTLRGAAFGEPADEARHDLGVQVKGATFTDLKVGRSGQGYVAQCVVDV